MRTLRLLGLLASAVVTVGVAGALVRLASSGLSTAPAVATVAFVALLVALAVGAGTGGSPGERTPYW